MLVTLKYGIEYQQLLFPLVKVTSVFQIIQLWENFCPWTFYSTDGLNTFSFSNTYVPFAQNVFCPNISPPRYCFLLIWPHFAFCSPLFSLVFLVSIFKIYVSPGLFHWPLLLYNSHFSICPQFTLCPGDLTHSHWFKYQLERKKESKKVFPGFYSHRSNKLTSSRISSLMVESV